MGLFKLAKLQTNPQRTCKVLLIIGWLSGLILGAIFSAGAGDSFLLMMRRVSFSVSIVSLFLVAVLPFLFAAYAVFLSNRFLIIMLAHLKGFSFGFCAFGLVTVYGTGFWLAGILWMFSDLGTLPLLMWFWIRCIDSRDSHLFRKLLWCLFCSALVVCGDFWIISPFAASIF